MCFWNIHKSHYIFCFFHLSLYFLELSVLVHIYLTFHCNCYMIVSHFCLYIPFLFIHSSVAKYLAYFPFLSIINNALVEILVNVSFCTFARAFLDYIPESGYFNFYFQWQGKRVSQCSHKRVYYQNFKILLGGGVNKRFGINIHTLLYVK